MEKYTESKEDTQPLSSASAKKLGEVKNVQLLDVLIHYTVVKVQLLALFFVFPSLPTEINRWFTW